MEYPKIFLISINFINMASENFTMKPFEYPRPTDNCSNCKGVIIFCYGKIRKPYWRHHVKSLCKQKIEGESAIHKICKKSILEFLRKGGKISMIGPCHKCEKLILKEVPKCHYYQEEVLIPNGTFRFDIAGMDSNGKIIFGIEVWCSNRTSYSGSVDARNLCEWYEIKTEEIESKLGYGNESEELTFFDYRINNTCLDASDCFSKRETYHTTKLSCSTETSVIIPKDPMPESSVDKPTKDSVLEKSSVFKPTAQELELDHMTIAKRLGHFKMVSRYNGEYHVHRLLDEAIKKKYFPGYETWVIEKYVGHRQGTKIDNWTYNSRNSKRAWDLFLYRQRCSKCDTSYPVTRQNIYCENCSESVHNNFDETRYSVYNSIYKKHDYIVDEFWDKWSVASDKWLNLRHALSFLNNKKIPTYKVGDREIRCYYCKTDLSTGVWWFGERKQICYDCINSKSEIIE